MTTAESNEDPVRKEQTPPVPLRLADSDADGSTQPVPPDPATADDLAAARSPSSEESSASEQTGGTTGGFETLLGRIVIRAGMVTAEEIEECNAALGESGASSEPQTLTDLLVAKEYITRHQLSRLRQEFEAQKSGQRIPGYKIKRKLGSGAMATVFLAKQISLDRPVAIKILPKRFSDNAKFIERFYKEGRAAAQLNHPNIVSAYDVGRAGDHHYFVMEYVDGETVHELLAKRKRFKEQEAIEVVRQVAKALAHAHERGFVHRDIKPKNIMITKAGRVKLADLGLARAIDDEEAARAEAGRAYGTPYYISPEQIRGELNIGPAADIYGLGATFYHMVTGRVPYEGKNPSEVMHRHLKTPLRPPDHINPDLSAGCAQVIEMMLAKRERDRYGSVQDLNEDLELIRNGEPPHFAHRSLDHAAITEAITDVASAPMVVQPAPPAPPTLAESPMLMTLVVLFSLSLLVNIILLVLMFTI